MQSKYGSYYKDLDCALQLSNVIQTQPVTISSGGASQWVVNPNDRRLALLFYTPSTNTIQLYPNVATGQASSFWQLTAGIFGLQLSVKIHGGIVKSNWYAASTAGGVLQIMEIIGPPFDDNI